jgi:hypothetical protein
VAVDELAADISALIRDQGRRSELSEAGRTFADRSSDESFAELLWERVLA